jgi:diguanylate cyclase (GGDEF)-like protein/PAS domain S-box-containing protein
VAQRRGETSGFRRILASLAGAPVTEPREGLETLATLDTGANLFRALADSTAAGVFIVKDGQLRYGNPGARALTGYAVDELVGLDFWQLVHPEFRESLRQRETSGAPAPTRQEVRLVTRDGERWVDLTMTRLEQDGRSTLVFVAFDVGERKLAESAHREAERRMRDILENVQLIAVLRDAGGEITFANEFFLELVGAEEEAVVGKDWFETFAPLEERETQREAFRERLHAGSALPYEETEILARLDERRLIAWNHTLLHDYQGEVIGAASIGADITERRRVERQLIHDAFHDTLTGLPNRALLMDRLVGALARARRRAGQLVAVLFLDVDRFKFVNDSLGHGAGDQLLIQMSKVLGACVRPGDTVARLGGDEFTILLEGLDEPADAVRVADRIQESLAAPFKLEGHEVFATASVGIAISTREYSRPEDLLRDADTAMYQAKAGGKARHQIFDTSMHNRAVQVLALENELRRAVEKKSFLLHYQPIVELQTGCIVALEALVRWEHSERGLVSPVEFVHLAEETGLIHEIGEWALAEACRSAREWVEELGYDLTINVNISSKQFSQTNLVEQVAGVLRETKLEPRRLKLEITESVIMENADLALEMLMRLRELGARVCIDDFGTGYSSLAYLLRFPADTLKIDRSFVTAMAKGGRNAQIVGSIVSLGAGLDMDVVAEGVETQIQREQLATLGCRLAQGFLFSRPVDRERIGALLADRGVRR